MSIPFPELHNPFSGLLEKGQNHLNPNFRPIIAIGS